VNRLRSLRRIIIIIIIINFIRQHKHKTDCKTAEHNMVKYGEQDRETQKGSYLGPKPNRN